MGLNNRKVTNNSEDYNPNSTYRYKITLCHGPREHYRMIKEHSKRHEKKGEYKKEGRRKTEGKKEKREEEGRDKCNYSVKKVFYLRLSNKYL